ncbi:MAG: Na+/H+ antiporter NhaC family protein [Bacteroidota bacterium]
MKHNSQQPALYQVSLPLISTIILLGCNMYFFGSRASHGPNQVALLLGAAFSLLLNRNRGITWEKIRLALVRNIQPILPTFTFLLIVAAMSATWLLSGVIPAIIYYGLYLLRPRLFLVTALLFCALVSVATGSSWATIATIGVAMLGLGKTLGWSDGTIGGAIISGAYFGDKLSPLSETTVMASSVTDTNIYHHIQRMMKTSIPTLLLVVLIFWLIGATQGKQVTGQLAQNTEISDYLMSHFNITPWLFLVPGIVLILILAGVSPLITLTVGALSGLLCIVWFRPPASIVWIGSNHLISTHACQQLARFICLGGRLESGSNHLLADLMSSDGVMGMLPTITLMITAILLGGALEATDSITTLASRFLRAKTYSSLITYTTLTGIFLNLTVADQYLAILLGGKIYTPIFKENQIPSAYLSSTLEDAITVTSPLIPWNTCGAAQAAVLGIATLSYLPFSFFNILTPLVGIIVGHYTDRPMKLRNP